MTDATMLADRALVRLSGEDVRGFLQGLVTNDVGGALPVWAGLLTPQGGDWAVKAPSTRPGGWAFQYNNAHYPDLDDTAVVVMAMDRAQRHSGSKEYDTAIARGREWIEGVLAHGNGRVDRANAVAVEVLVEHGGEHVLPEGELEQIDSIAVAGEVPLGFVDHGPGTLGQPRVQTIAIVFFRGKVRER